MIIFTIRHTPIVDINFQSHHITHYMIINFSAKEKLMMPPFRLIAIALAVWSLCIIPCVSKSIHTPMFISQNIPPRRCSLKRQKIILPYKDDTTVENIDVGNGGSSTDDGIDSTFTDPQNIEEEIIVEDKNDWLSGSSRTLGSLFLREEDENRDKNVDVFGRPLLVGGGEDGEERLKDNALANYLMNLKLAEEDNREKAAEQHTHDSQSGKKKKDSEKKGGGGLFQQKDADQELDESVSKLYVSEELMNDMKICPSDGTEVYDHGRSSLVKGKDVLQL